MPTSTCITARHKLAHQNTCRSSLQRRVGSRKFCSKGLIPWVNDLQAWLILLMCASTRANFWLRAVAPELTAEFAGQCGDACARSWEFRLGPLKLRWLQVWRCRQEDWASPAPGPHNRSLGKLGRLFDAEAGLQMPPGGLAATSCEACGAGIHSKRGVADVG